MLDLNICEAEFKSRQAIDRSVFLNAVMLRYGYDFSQYADNMLNRRLDIFKSHFQVKHLTEIIPQLISDHKVFDKLVNTLSISVTEFFREPKFFSEFNQKVIPFLKTYPYISFWCAGCATGEEAYSWAILLAENGLLNRSIIYATDINQNAIKQAKQASYDIKLLDTAVYNYQQSGGKNSFEDYCSCDEKAFTMSSHLTDKICFTSHNLVHDSVFAEMLVVSCRNVLIYFDNELKDKTINLFSESLKERSFFCTGESEAIHSIDSINNFELFSNDYNIYRKLKACG